MGHTRAGDQTWGGLVPPAPHARWVEVEQVDLPRNLGAVLDAACERFPDNVAWQFPALPDHPRARLTYAELVVEVDRMAAALGAVGVTRGSHVGALLRNVPEFPLLWLALARMGAVIVPVNPLYRPRELDHVATLSEMTHLVIDPENLPVLAEAERTLAQIPAEGVITAGELAAPAAHARLEELLAAVGDPARVDADPHPDDLLNIQFTSGTTGFPKGCMLTHRYWVTLGHVGMELSGGPQRLLADHPFFYMQNQAYLAKSMFAGGRLVVTPRMSRARFFDWLADYEIDYTWYVDVMHTTPARPEDRQTSLIFVSSAGIHGELHRAAEERFGVPIRDSYASTELGPGIAVPIDRGDLMERPGVIGFPTPFREAKIVDAELRDVPPGTRGELLVRGPGIFLGYYNDSEATAENIVDGGWFRTGDLCSMSEEGCFSIHGRIKESINRSGENIAAGEVEAVLRSVPHVDEVAVIGVPDEERGQEVKAYLVLVEGHEHDVPPEAVLAVCERELAPFKVPRYLEYRTELPMTASGKVAKATLAAERDDLRVGAYDRVEGCWHAEPEPEPVTWPDDFPAPWTGVAKTTLPRLLDAIYREHGDAPAVIFDDGAEVSFATLRDRTERFAGYLRGVLATGDRVALAIGNRAEYLIAYFAVVANRGVVVSVSPTIGAHDAEHVVRDAGCVLAIGDPQSAAILREVAASTGLRDVLIAEDGEPDGLLRWSEGVEPLRLADAECEIDDLVDIGYTSGTTGLPKALGGDHLELLRYVDVSLRARGFQPGDRVLAPLQLHYGDPLYLAVTGWTLGAPIILMRKFSVSRFFDVARRFGATRIYSIGSIPNLLLTKPPSPADRDHRIRLANALAIPPAQHRELNERFGFPWVEAYGSSESGPAIAMPAAFADEYVGTGALGVPYPDIEARLVDEAGRVVEGPGSGELELSGSILFPGYLDDEVATAEVLHDDWLRTGDLMRRDERGVYYFLGRRKELIRRGGENIAPAEVEAVLRLHDAVVDAAVVPVEDEIRGEEVLAYVQIVAEGAASPDELVAFCADRLAPFKVPRYIHLRTEPFPRTPSQRIPKQQLKVDGRHRVEDAWDRTAA